MKGLEFDGVVVVEPDEILGDTPRGARLLYVAMTRAVQELAFVTHAARRRTAGAGLSTRVVRHRSARSVPAEVTVVRRASVAATSDASYVNIYEAFPAGYEAMPALEQACAGAMDPVLFELVKLRASQVNGCAYCIDMHWKDARAAGETRGAAVHARRLARGRRVLRRGAGRAGARRGDDADRRRARAGRRRGRGPAPASTTPAYTARGVHDRHDQRVEPAGHHAADSPARPLPSRGRRATS